MEPLELSDEGQRLTTSLEAACARRSDAAPREAIHISGVGERLYFAYEQLRNAAEYGERHLLIRRAIERFLRRYMHLRHEVPTDLAIELVSELTHARYIKNDSIARSTVRDIMAIAERYAKLTNAVREAHSVPAEQLATWIYQSASVEIEHQLVPHADTDAFMEFAFHHYSEHIERGQTFGQIDDTTYELALHCAVHRTLFKSDMATIRYYAIAQRLGAGGGNSLDYFVWLNAQLDNLYQTPTVNRLGRLVNKYGAPMRILREVLIDSNEPQKVLTDEAGLMTRVLGECQVQYKALRHRINEGVVRSILFIFITKVLIGIAIEVPYDLVTLGSISVLPLLVNLLFPPAYMATIGFSVRTPGQRNTEVIQSYIRRIIYKTDDPPLRYRIKRRVTARSLTTAFNAIYTIAFLISFGLVVYLLRLLGYNIVNGIIFFVFFSAVSFFGFRLSQTAKELEILDQRKSLISVIFDFFYTPFIRVGNWLSDRYARLNLVAFILDMAIELPLKSILKIIQQWAGFIRDKQEEL